MEKYKYKTEDTRQIVVFAIGVLIIVSFSVIAYMSTDSAKKMLGIVLFPGAVGMAMILYGIKFDNDSFLAKAVFSPSMLLERSCPFYYGTVRYAYDKTIPLLCASRMESIQRYEVLYYSPEEIDVQIDVEYTLVIIRKRENISGAEAGFAFFLGGLPLALGAALMGNQKDTGEVKAISKVAVRIIPRVGSDKELSSCLFADDEEEKYEKGKTKSINGLRYLEKAKEFQDAVAEGQAAAGENHPLSDTINWKSMDYNGE